MGMSWKVSHTKRILCSNCFRSSQNSWGHNFCEHSLLVFAPVSDLSEHRKTLIRYKLKRKRTSWTGNTSRHYWVWSNLFRIVRAINYQDAIYLFRILKKKIYLACKTFLSLLTCSRRVTYYCVVDDMSMLNISLDASIDEETCLLDFQVIMKQKLQNC